VLDLDALISRTIPLDELPATLVAAPGYGEVKVMVWPHAAD
jgi:hypothetical protein